MAAESDTGKRVRFMSGNPGKRATERFYLIYIPVWGIICGSVMLTDVAERWGDVQLMIFGVGLWLPVLLGPLLWRAPEDRGKRFWKLYGFKIHAWLFLFAFFGNYITFYFYEVLHMHYGFRTEWNVNNTPLFLYFLTVAYFSMYCVLLNIGYRFAASLLSGYASRWACSVLIIPVCFAVAALETALNANPFMKSLFCYDDMTFMLWFGTIMYGTYFIIALPFWFTIDERPGVETPWKNILVGILAAFLLIMIADELFKWVIAPHFTTVVNGAVGLRDFEGSCLVPPG